MPISPAPPTIDLRRGLDYVGVSIVTVCHDGTGNILLQKRGPKARDEQGHWDVCGGALEFGEKIEDTIKREAQEELRTDVSDIQFLVAYEAHRQHNGQPTHWIALLHAAKIDPKKAKIGEPHKIDEIGWFTLDTLPSPMHSQFPKALAALKYAKILR